MVIGMAHYVLVQCRCDVLGTARGPLDGGALQVGFLVGHSFSENNDSHSPSDHAISPCGESMIMMKVKDQPTTT